MSAIADLVARYSTNASKGLYIRPYMDGDKVALFTKRVNAELGTRIEPGGILLLFAEKIAGSTVKGVAITEDCLLICMEMVACFSLESIESAAISGIINKRITLGLEGGQTVSFVLKRGNKGAKAIAEIIGRYISQGMD
jgi:hypothetical protein